jgi:adenylate cyclase
MPEHAVLESSKAEAAYSEAASIASWLAEHGGARIEPEALLSALCEQLLAAGLPLSRASFGVPTLHPQICGYQVIWQRGAGSVTKTRHESDTPSTSYYLASPMWVLDQGAAAVRRRLDVADPQLDFPILHELIAEGATDYAAMPLHFTSGRAGYITWTSDRPGGFSAADLMQLDALLPLIALRLELEASYEISVGLLETYLGRDAASRVLEGKVRRGEGKRMRAAILVSDLRDFTALADRLPAEQIIEILDLYFDIMVTQVHAHGGEVLKFIGDGMLAVFDVESVGHEAACCRAVHAATAAIQAIARLNEGRDDALRVGIALHLGEVIYGNIGGAGRLDFTVIGRAVNEAARMEELCRTLDRAILTSASFGRGCTCEPLVSLGQYQLRGIEGAREIFTLAPG